MIAHYLKSNLRCRERLLGERAAKVCISTTGWIVRRGFCSNEIALHENRDSEMRGFSTGGAIFMFFINVLLYFSRHISGVGQIKVSTQYRECLQKCVRVQERRCVLQKSCVV